MCSGSLGSTDTQPLNFHIIPPSPYKLLVACLVVAAAPATFFLLLIIAARVGGSQSCPGRTPHAPVAWDGENSSLRPENAVDDGVSPL